MLAALLFGALHQGGAELAFEIPAITREMVVVIQGLIILFSGALAQHAAAVAAARCSRCAARRGGVMDDGFVAASSSMLAATLRVATPLILCAMGGLFSERSGIIDVGLEGKMLMAAFFAAATSPRSPARPGRASPPPSSRPRRWRCCTASPASPIAATRW